MGISKDELERNLIEILKSLAPERGVGEDNTNGSREKTPDESQIEVLIRGRQSVYRYSEFCINESLIPDRNPRS